MKGLECQAEDVELVPQVVGVPEGLQTVSWYGKNPCAAVREVTGGPTGPEAAV